METAIADLGNKRHRLVATSRPTEMLHDGIYRATSLLYAMQVPVPGWLPSTGPDPLRNSGLGRESDTTDSRNAADAVRQHLCHESVLSARRLIPDNGGCEEVCQITLFTQIAPDEAALGRAASVS